MVGYVSFSVMQPAGSQLAVGTVDPPDMSIHIIGQHDQPSIRGRVGPLEPREYSISCMNIITSLHN